MPIITSPVLLIEGTGDQEAVPVLIRRIIAAMNEYDINPAQRPIKTGDIARLQRRGELERFVEYGALRDDGDGVILLIDCDDGCPRTVAQDFTERVAAMRPTIAKPVGIGFLKKEFEGLLLTDIERISQTYPEFGWDLAGFDVDQDMEEIRGAKGQISRLMRPGRSYKPTQHQARFISQCDCGRLHLRSRSYRHCEALVEWMAGRRHPEANFYPIA